MATEPVTRRSHKDLWWWVKATAFVVTLYLILFLLFLVAAAPPALAFIMTAAVGVMCWGLAVVDDRSAPRATDDEDTADE